MQALFILSLGSPNDSFIDSYEDDEDDEYLDDEEDDR